MKTNGKIKYIFEVLRYGCTLRALGCLVSSYAWHIHDHIAPLAKMKKKNNSQIHPTASLRCGENISIGENSHINQYCCIWASENSKIILGDNLLMGPGVKIFSSNHGIKKYAPINTQDWIEKDVIIGNDVWLGANVVIVPGVFIGDGCIVGAGAVVTKDIPANSIAAGVPANVIGQRQ